MMRKILSPEEEENENNRWLMGKMRKTRKRPFTIEKTRGVYDMSSETRGWCLIFSNHVFKYLEKLLGYERDKEYFEIVFTDLGFRVKIFEKVTAEEMKSNIQKYANMSASDGLQPTNAFVVVILSHGGENYLCGVNFSEKDRSDKISVTEIIDILSNQNCPHLIGKPKIICLQACRGNKFDLGLNNDFPSKNKHQDINPTPTATTLRSGKKLHYDEMDDKIRILPSVVEDMMISYATTLNYASYVPLTGSIFGVQLCVHLKRYAWNRDLHDIMLSVSNALRSKDIIIDEKISGKQVLEINYISPTKKLYFNPGYFKSNVSSTSASTSHSNDINVQGVQGEESKKNIISSDQPNESIANVNAEKVEPDRKHDDIFP
ncbi:hypothetical protein HA402_012695 [Bradysia odoriphaga]|nr:hypothetical protein HA402_012695 [Bradysia odoriphaga]